MATKVKKNKLKTNSGAAKRFKATGSGKYRFRRAERAHGSTKKNSNLMRKRRANGTLKDCDAKIVDALLKLV